MPATAPPVGAQTAWFQRNKGLAIAVRLMDGTAVEGVLLARGGAERGGRMTAAGRTRNLTTAAEIWAVAAVGALNIEFAMLRQMHSLGGVKSSRTNRNRRRADNGS